MSTITNDLIRNNAKEYSKLKHVKRKLNKRITDSTKINSVIYNDKKEYLIIEDSSSNDHFRVLKSSDNEAVESWLGNDGLESINGVTRSDYLNSSEISTFVSESDVKRAFGRKFKNIYKDANLKVYGINPDAMYSIGEDKQGRKVWCDVNFWYYGYTTSIIKTLFGDDYTKYEIDAKDHYKMATIRSCWLYNKYIQQNKTDCTCYHSYLRTNVDRGQRKHFYDKLFFRQSMYEPASNPNTPGIYGINYYTIIARMHSPASRYGFIHGTYTHEKFFGTYSSRIFYDINN